MKRVPPRSSSRLGLTALLLASATLAAAQKLPTATKVWSVGPVVKAEPMMGITFARGGATLSGPQADSQTESVFAATRSIAFSGDRIVVAMRTGSQTSQNYLLLSINSNSGEIKDSREFHSFGIRGIFPTNDSHVIVSGSSVLRLTPDLKDDGEFGIEAGSHNYARIENISPDGSTLGNATSPGYELINSATFKVTKLTGKGVVDTSVNDSGFVTDNDHWTRGYPSDISFVTYVDANGDHLLYHGRCGGRPQFLTNDLILEPGCKSPLIIDTKGDLVKKLSVRGDFSFAGSAQNGTRFALQVARFGAMHSLKQERFVIYSMTTWEPIAEITPDEAAEGQSWTALSPEGSLFVVGSPSRLTLYRLP